MLPLLTGSSILLFLLLLAEPTFGQYYMDYAPGSAWEFAYDYSTDACPSINPRSHMRGDVPDSMPIAWFNRKLNVSSFISATSQGVHASTSPGSTLDELARKDKDCQRVVFNSSFLKTPESFANHQWLQSVRVFDNGSAFGLVHNEFKPELIGAPEENATYCSCLLHQNCSRNSACELWSTGLAESDDGGTTFKLVARPPAHVTFVIPHKYVSNERSLAGYGAVGTMLPGSDGYYYGLVNIAGSIDEGLLGMSGIRPGNCAFRTNDFRAGPSSFRGWDGSAYTVQWRSPYLGSGATGQGKCVTLPTNTSSSFDAHVCVRRFTDGGRGSSTSRGFVAVGPHPLGVRYSFCDQEGGEAFEHCAGNYASWSSIGSDNEHVLSVASADRWQSTAGRVLYPVLIDHHSPSMGEKKAAASKPGSASMWREDGDNYALTGLESSSLWLYFVSSGRNILRRRVVFSETPPRPPPPPPPPLPPGCQHVLLSGAGVVAANGLYTRANHSAAPMFVKDTSHQIYRFNVSGSWQWHLAHNGVAGSVLYINTNPQAIKAAPTQDEPPSWGWSLGAINASSHFELAPAPEALACTDERGL